LFCQGVALNCINANNIKVMWLKVVAEGLLLIAAYSLLASLLNIEDARNISTYLLSCEKIYGLSLMFTRYESLQDARNARKQFQILKLTRLSFSF